MTKTVIKAEAAGKPAGPYSQAVTVDDWIFVSAEKGVDPATGKIVEGGVRCVVFLRNMENFVAMNEV